MNRALKASYLGLIYLFFYVPLIVLAAHSFNDSAYLAAWKGFTTRWYAELLQDDDLIEAALNSLFVASVSATLAAVIGTLAAVSIHRYRFPGRKILTGFVYILLMAPDIVMGISFLILYVSANVSLGAQTVIVSHITLALPFVTVTVLSRLAGFDKNVVEAAKDLGAGEFDTFRYVILPMLLPAVISGWLLAFTLSLDDVIISFFVTGPEFEILPLKVYSMVRVGVKPEVNALCTLMLAVTLVVVVSAQSMLKEKK